MTKKGKPQPKYNGQRSSSPEDVQIGARIRAIRMDRKLSQEQLGEGLGVSFQQVQKYEKGNNRVSAVRLNQIAQILKTTPEQLSGFNKTAPPVETFKFDIESYKLAKAFTQLPDPIKSKMRSLINSILDNT